MERYNSMMNKEAEGEKDLEQYLVDLNEMEKLKRKPTSQKDAPKLVRSSTEKDKCKKPNFTIKVSTDILISSCCSIDLNA